MSLALSIGKAANELGLSAHTLRYYEKIGLIPAIGKDKSGRRRYDEHDIARIQFIKRAQKMQFSLDEIKQLLNIKSSEETDKLQVQILVKDKLAKIQESITDLTHLKQDLSQLLMACEQSEPDQDCPIIQGINVAKKAAD